MPRAKTETITLFCTNCGETKTFQKNDERPLPKSCKECLQGDMLEAVHTNGPDAH